MKKKRAFSKASACTMIAVRSRAKACPPTLGGVMTGLVRPQLPSSMTILLRPSSSRLQPLIKPRPWTAARADITPTYKTGNRTKLRAVGIGDPTGDEIRDAKPHGGDRQRPRNLWNRNARRCTRSSERVLPPVDITDKHALIAKGLELLGDFVMPRCLARLVNAQLDDRGICRWIHMD